MVLGLVLRLGGGRILQRAVCLNITIFAISVEALRARVRAAYPANHWECLELGFVIAVIKLPGFSA